MSQYVLVSIGAGVYFSEFAYLLVINIDKKTIVETYKYRHRVYNQSTKGFVGVFLGNDNKAVITTEAELMEFSLHPLKMTQYVTGPWFNDVHYAIYDKEHDQIIVCNAGLDSLEVFNTNYIHCGSFSLVKKGQHYKRCAKAALGSYLRKVRDFRLRLKRTITPVDFFAEDIRYKNLDRTIWFANLRKLIFPRSLYRRGHDNRYVLFRPHVLHPNFLCAIGGEMLVTLRNIGEVVSLNTGETIISGLDGPHDGILQAGTFLITESNQGTLRFADGVGSVTDLQTSHLECIRVCCPRQGFVRGVNLLNDRTAIVGVSKRRDAGDDKPCWLALVDLREKKVIDRFEVPYVFGTNPFSVVNVSHVYGHQSFHSSSTGRDCK